MNETKTKNGFGLFSFSSFVPIRVGLRNVAFSKYLCTITVYLSLYGECVARFPLADGVFYLIVTTGSINQTEAGLATIPVDAYSDKLHYDTNLFFVCCHAIYSGCQAACGRTSRGYTGGRSPTISPPSFSAVLALFFLARMIQPFLSHVDREVDILCAYELALIILHVLCIFIISSYNYYFVRNNPSSCDCTEIRTHVPT